MKLGGGRGFERFGQARIVEGWVLLAHAQPFHKQWF